MLLDLGIVCFPMVKGEELGDEQGGSMQVWLAGINFTKRCTW